MSKQIILVVALICGLAPLGLVLYVKSGPARAKVEECRPQIAQKIENIERVFMERPTSFVFMYRNQEGRYKLTSLHADDVTFVPDVPHDKSLWASKLNCSADPYYSSLEIHLRSAQDVNGAGWNAGKGGAGMTVPVQ